ncbi:MAG: cyclopropane-fatty-acyl-phospholipid synthase family protein [Pseudomonadales bacterium]|nr:cyclopropane-fatty-acyl-phospholipid synthase family protein [Pseudomonadales bacterium]MDP6470614.1 cyclopropane-fatty-acyl-phospholipid synthase family protein [Pseudomonadales bacterium]MDP6828531.1 cyclopropane-fatty-acyl-phospholipid synthase family protein [Pseudomonadales bacterium]MDP6973138.1 cyclopropane-fatty-acyl-phospholipid synthase family protein [Pseudomonadales bacterium]
MQEFELFKQLVRYGELTIIDHDGRHYRFGHTSTRHDEPRASWRLTKPGVVAHILANPLMNLGESYLDGRWDVAEGSLHDLLSILRTNLETAVTANSTRALLSKAAGQLLQSWNGIRASYRNISHHYDLDEALFRACLDEDMHYSCAYYSRPDMTLDQAQRAKCDLIAAKLCLESGQHVLDIGCGWGSLPIALAERFGVRVTGLTLSREQLRTARARIRGAGLEKLIDIHQMDYREHSGRYDRVVSVGMFEHVGKRNHTTFMRKVSDCLTSDGIALLHTIGSRLPPEPVNPWIRRHIFPGGYLPSLSEVAQAVEKSGLNTTDIEIWRQHYALTLSAWNANFQRHRVRFARERGERFCRMWEFYLVISQTAFEAGITTVQHWQLARHHLAVPTTRHYLLGASSAPALTQQPPARADSLRPASAGSGDSARRPATRAADPE